MRKTDEVIAALNCFKTRQPKCGSCPYNPRPGRDWPYGCIAGQGQAIEDAQALLRRYEETKANEQQQAGII